MNANDVLTLTPKPTAHFKKQIREKRFNPYKVVKMLNDPVECYPSGSHPGQWRLTGEGLCAVGKPEGEHLIPITIYEDRVLTAPRPEQMDTAEGRRYAGRYNNGRVRG